MSLCKFTTWISWHVKGCSCVKSFRFWSIYFLALILLFFNFTPLFNPYLGNLKLYTITSLPAPCQYLCHTILHTIRSGYFTHTHHKALS